MTLADLVQRLQEFDLLLSSDSKFPSVSDLVIGPGINGPWWSHPDAHEMYRLVCELSSHPDVLTAKLISGKVTLIQRALWPAVFTIGTAREPWQMSGLSKEARALLVRVDKEKRLRTSGDAVRALEGNLLVHSESVHTERGSHAKELETWESWARRVKLGKVKLSTEEAKAQIEQVVSRLNRQSRANGTLPWVRRRTQVSPLGQKL